MPDTVLHIPLDIQDLVVVMHLITSPQRSGRQCDAKDVHMHEAQWLYIAFCHRGLLHNASIYVPSDFSGTFVVINKTICIMTNSS